MFSFYVEQTSSTNFISSLNSIIPQKGVLNTNNSFSQVEKILCKDRENITNFHKFFHC